MNFDDRINYLQSWWLASRLIRRHPELGLIETHPGGGMYDCLTVIQWDTEPSTLAQLNRVGTVHAGPDNPTIFDWGEERRHDDRYWGVKAIEDAAALPHPPHTPAATRTSLTMRVLYQILLQTINDRDTWDIRNARIDSSGMTLDEGDVSGFRTAEISAGQVRPDDPYGSGLYRFWKVFKGVRCVAVVDVDGLLHHHEGEPTDLLMNYRQAGRSAARLALDVISDSA